MTIMISSDSVYNGIISGAGFVIQHKLDLNKINVFPVPDGDTGTNMAMTMIGIIEESKIYPSMKKTLETVANAAIKGARGNSGLIFAQYLNGLYLEISDREEISIEDFVRACNLAVNYAYLAIEEPREGTMITIIKDWANYLNNHFETVNDFNSLIYGSLTEIYKSLKETTNKIQALKKANVVDSGAKGFVHFIEGFLNFLKTKEKIIIDIDNVDFDTEDVHTFDKVNLENRYCTEALISDISVDINDIKKNISPLGDSLIIAGNKTRTRIHIHTKYPNKIFDYLHDVSFINHQKVDDMARQFDVIHNRKYKIGLICDSVADIPLEIKDQYQICTLPLNIIVDSTNYLDKLTITNKRIFQLLKDNATITTSIPSIKEIERFISFVKSNYDQVIIITVSSKMSGTNNIIKKACSNLKYQESEVKVIDTKLNSVAEGLVTLECAKMIKNSLAFDEIIKQTEEIIEKTNILVSIDNLNQMIRSGRISKNKGHILNALSFKPVISINKDGEGIIQAKTFSLKQNVAKIEKIIKSMDKVYTYAIVYSTNILRVEQFKELMIKITGKEPTYICESSSIIAIGSGENTIGISVIKE